MRTITMRGATTMPTPTLYKFISSELHRVTPDEIVDDGELVFFDSDHQIMPKILDFDNDVQDITDNLFNGLSLDDRSEEHTSELQSRFDLVCRLLLEKTK